MSGRLIGLLTAALLSITGCTYNDGTPNRTATGAATGAVTGALAGNLIGGDSRSAVIGGLLGAGAGTAIGGRQQRQQAAQPRYY